ncbi:MAG: Uma2 family endonuclease [Cyanobacteriota bacterium]|nr:Uma2 family endonuclease [Cyanobacteriota bacterium]
MLATERETQPQPLSLEDWLLAPPDRTEWAEGEIIEKNGMTAKHGRIQAKLSRYWGNHKDSSSLGGEIYVETSCRTVGRGRSPDVAYLSPTLIAQFGDFTTLPQSFLLIAEIVSPTDLAEEVFAKVKEYLQSGCEEVWLVFPESQWVLVITQHQQTLYGSGDTASTSKILPGFSVAVDELLA